MDNSISPGFQGSGISRETYLYVTHEIIRGRTFASTSEMAQYIAECFTLMAEAAQQFALDEEVNYVQNIINAL